MSALGEARRLFGQGRQADAVACVEAAGDKGDGEALPALRIGGCSGCTVPAIRRVPNPCWPEGWFDRLATGAAER